MTPLRLIAAGLMATLPLVAVAQWQWIDKDGRRIFSDQAPPPDVPAKNILRQPGGRPAAADPAPSASGGTPTAAAPALPRPSGQDKALEEKNRKAEAEELAKRRAEHERIAQERADNCERAKRAKATLDSGQRIATTNSKGEREILDDNARAAELKRIEGLIDETCKPMPPFDEKKAAAAAPGAAPNRGAAPAR